MIWSVIRAVQRGIATRIYTPNSRSREEKLSVSGVFDFALSNPSKREIVRYLGTNSVGVRKTYEDEDFESLGGVSYNVVYRGDYMDKYAGSSESERARSQKAKQRYVEFEAIPELVECKVLEAVVETEDEGEVFVSEVDELLELGVIKAYKSQYKKSGIFVHDGDSDAEIVGVRPGARFDFAYEALKNVYLTFEDKEISEEVF